MLEEKKCIKCCEVKPIDNFYKSKQNKTGHENTCKLCRRSRQVENGIKDYLKKYNKDNRDTISSNSKKYYQANKEYLINHGKQYRDLNKEKINKRLKEKRKLNPDPHKKASKKWREKTVEHRAEKNKEWRNNQSIEYYEKENKKRRDKYNSDSDLRKRQLDNVIKNRKKHAKLKSDLWLRSLLRIRMINFLKTNGTKKNKKTINLIGCSFKTAIEYLNSLGYNRYDHDIDHIVPLSAFNITNTNHQKIMFHYLNMKPETPQYNRHIKRNNLTKDWKDVIIKIGNIRNVCVDDIIKYIDNRISINELKYMRGSDVN